MTAEVKFDGESHLVIRIPINLDPQPSSSGKTLIVATTGGFQKTECTHKGKPISIAVNITIPVR